MFRNAGLNIVVNVSVVQAPINDRWALVSRISLVLVLFSYTVRWKSVATIGSKTDCCTPALSTKARNSSYISMVGRPDCMIRCNPSALPAP